MSWYTLAAKFDKRHIGRQVKLVSGDPRFNGQTGTIRAIRGSYGRDKQGKNIPCVYVYVDATKSVWPWRGDQLELM